MNVKFLVLISTIGLVNAGGTSNEKEKKYPPIKFILEGKSLYLPLSDQIKLTRKQTLYCACPKDSIDDLAQPCTGKEDDICSQDYAPLFSEKFASCGPSSNGDLKVSNYLGKINSNEVEDYNLNVFQICEDKMNNIPRFAFASYNILPSTNSVSPSLDDLSQLLPENLQKLYAEKTESYRKKKGTEDTLVPQRLISSKSIPQWFSKGKTDTSHNLMPQWKAKFSKWNYITEFVENKAQNNDFNVIAGASSKSLDDTNNINRQLKRIKIDESTVPDFWWIIIRNFSKKKAIVFVMDNEPDERNSEKKLCPSIDLKKTIWKNIKLNENDASIYACALTKELFEQLINLDANTRYTLFDKEIPFTKERMYMRSLSLIYG